MQNWEEMQKLALKLNSTDRKGLAKSILDIAWWIAIAICWSRTKGKAVCCVKNGKVKLRLLEIFSKYSKFGNFLLSQKGIDEISLLKSKLNVLWNILKLFEKNLSL